MSKQMFHWCTECNMWVLHKAHYQKQTFKPNVPSKENLWHPTMPKYLIHWQQQLSCLIQQLQRGLLLHLRIMIHHPSFHTLARNYYCSLLQPILPGSCEILVTLQVLKVQTIQITAATTTQPDSGDQTFNQAVFQVHSETSIFPL